MGDFRLPTRFSTPQHYYSYSSSSSPVAGADDDDGSSSLSSRSSSPLLSTSKSKNRLLRLPIFSPATSRRSPCNTNGDYKPKKSRARNFFMKFFTSPKKQSGCSSSSSTSPSSSSPRTTLPPESCPWASPTSTISFDVEMEKSFVEEVCNASPSPPESCLDSSDPFDKISLAFPLLDIIEPDVPKANGRREVSFVEKKLVSSYIAYSMVLARLWMSRWERKLHLFASMKFAGVHGHAGKIVFLLAKAKQAMMIKGRDGSDSDDDEEKVWYRKDVKGLRCRPVPEVQ